MRSRRLLPVLRRWSWIVVAGVLMGVVVGWVSAPSSVATRTTYEATHTMLLDPRSDDVTAINRAAVMATLGAVPDRVATRLGLDPERVRSMVSAGTRDDVGELLITGRSPDPAEAEALADVTAEELLVELGGENAPLRTLEPAVASPVGSDEIVAPSSRPTRAVLLGAFGLLLGVGGALAVDRFDNRIRSTQAAEDVLGLPVVAEVPPVRGLGPDPLVAGGPPSPFTEAYRMLRTNVDRWLPPPADGQGGRVIVVTSPAAGEGKTTTVAHLAVALADMGRSVVAVSADLRRPRLHLYFDRAPEPGLVDVLRGAPDTRELGDVARATRIRGVRFIPSGAPVANPAPLLDGVGAHLRAARQFGDYVVVDTPGLLTASEAADLVRLADAVLLVVRSGRTSVGAAAHSAEVLARLGVPVLGLVLVGGDRRVRR